MYMEAESEHTEAALTEEVWVWEWECQPLSRRPRYVAHAEHRHACVAEEEPMEWEEELMEWEAGTAPAMEEALHL
jgi:hypothetical protein